jgi:homoserine kinase
MSMASASNIAPLRQRLPATSANLGAGFDAAAVALDFYLEVEAELAPKFSIAASGRDAERCSQVEDNLILSVYRRVVEENGRPALPIAVRMMNGIPLGMGCGSSAAGRLAGIALAVHFGQLGWSDQQVLEKASALEGHPDNAAACWLGGYVSAAEDAGRVHVARVTPPSAWKALVVLPAEPLATSKARALLPATYPREDVIANLQAVSLLGLAFAQGRGDLLRMAMRDRIHQPYRSSVCPMLPRLLPLAGKDGILGAALSGAGPAVLMIVDGPASMDRAKSLVQTALHDVGTAELIACGFEVEGARRAILQTTP